MNSLWNLLKPQIFLVVLMAWMPAQAEEGLQTDTLELIIKGKRIVIQLDNLNELQALEEFSIDSIIKSLNEVLRKLEARSASDTNTAKGGQVFIYTVSENKGKPPINISTSHFSNIQISVKENEDGTDHMHVRIVNKTKKKDDFNEVGLDLSLGWNNYLSAGAFPIGKQYELDAGRSRFARLGMIFHLPFNKKKRAPAIRTGLELSYYNFMFDQQKRVVDQDAGNYFYEDSVNIVRKSKLRVAYLGLPIMLEFEVNNGKKQRGIHASIGADVAYRIGSRSISKFNDKKKSSKGGSYDLAPLQYTLRAELGYRFLTLTAGYTINSMFVEGSTPEVNRIYVGFRI